MTTYRVYNKEYVIDLEADSFEVTTDDAATQYLFKAGDKVVGAFDFYQIIGVKEMTDADKAADDKAQNS